MVMSHSPVFKTPAEETIKQTDTTEIMKRIQSLHGKVEACRTDIKNIFARLAALEGHKQTEGKIVEGE